MNPQRARHLAHDIAEPPRLDAGAQARREGVAVHGIALPDDGVSTAADGVDVGREESGDVRGAVAGDERDFADFAGRVEEVEQGGEGGRGKGGTDFDADGVGDAADVFDVGVREVAGAVADPEEVRGGVVVVALRAGSGAGGL